MLQSYTASIAPHLLLLKGEPPLSTVRFDPLGGECKSWLQASWSELGDHLENELFCRRGEGRWALRPAFDPPQPTAPIPRFPMWIFGGLAALPAGLRMHVGSPFDISSEKVLVLSLFRHIRKSYLEWPCHGAWQLTLACLLWTT